MSLEQYIGVHMRVYGDLFDTFIRAQELQVSIFQFFLLDQESRKHLQLRSSERARCAQKQQFFKATYVHGAYWINVCAQEAAGSLYLLRKELRWTTDLQVPYYILHPGAFSSSATKAQGIDNLVRVLDCMADEFPTVTILLENTAHGNRAIGSDLNDFGLIRTQLKKPERIGFCVDTAHAHVYGYDVITASGLDAFYHLLEQTMGLSSIYLIHANDTDQRRGSCTDSHLLPGKGLIGLEAIKKLCSYPGLQSVPIIIEMPEDDFTEYCKNGGNVVL